MMDGNDQGGVSYEFLYRTVNRCIYTESGDAVEMAAEEGRQKEALPLRNAEVLIPEREWGWGGGWLCPLL